MRNNLLTQRIELQEVEIGDEYSGLAVDVGKQVFCVKATVVPLELLAEEADMAHISVGKKRLNFFHTSFDRHFLVLLKERDELLLNQLLQGAAIDFDAEPSEEVQELRSVHVFELAVVWLACHFQWCFFLIFLSVFDGLVEYLDWTDTTLFTEQSEMLE